MTPAWRGYFVLLGTIPLNILPPLVLLAVGLFPIALPWLALVVVVSTFLLKGREWALRAAIMLLAVGALSAFVFASSLFCRTVWLQLLLPLPYLTEMGLLVFSPGVRSYCEVKSRKKLIIWLPPGR